MRTRKIIHGFPSRLLIHCLMVLHCLHTSDGQEDLDTSYLLRSGGGIPGEGMAEPNISESLKDDIETGSNFAHFKESYEKVLIHLYFLFS